MRPWRRFPSVLAVATRRWLAPRTSLFAAALAFQALLAIAPLLLVLLSVAGRLLGHERARGSLAEAAVRFAGPGADRVVSALLDLMGESRGQTSGTVLGITLMLFFASSFFALLRMALDAVWEVRGKRLGRKLFERAISFAQTLLAIAVLALLLAVGAARAIVGPWLVRTGAVGAMAWATWTRVGTLLMTSVVLAAMFRYIPFVRPRPRAGAVLAGAIPAALALNLANEVIGLIIAKSALVPLYGAAGTLVVILLWVQYSAWIFLLGAEVCRAWDDPCLEAVLASEQPGP
jgi:membrane protein